MKDIIEKLGIQKYWSTPHFALEDCNCTCGYVFAGENAHTVCDVYTPITRNEHDHGELPTKEEAAKNALLIAAAPEMLEALICQKALDMHPDKGYQILEQFGWSYANRLELSASEFVKMKTDEALNKATDGKIKELLK